MVHGEKQWFKIKSINPIESMYGIFAYIYHKINQM